MKTSERRSYLRFRTVLPVLVDSPVHGTRRCIARNVSSGGLCVEMDDPFPLNSEVRVWFVAPDGTRITATGMVRNHYFFNYCTGDRHRQLRGMGVRFVDFRDTGEHALKSVLSRMRLH